MATSEPDEGGVTTYRFRCCERCGGQANEHPVRHIELHLHRDARVRPVQQALNGYVPSGSSRKARVTVANSGDSSRL
jgi:hypothetical protein